MISLARSLQCLTNLSQSSLDLKKELQANMGQRFNNIEGNYILSVCALLDPRFKKLAFDQAFMYQSTVEKLSGEVTLAQSKENSEQSRSTTCRDSCRSSLLWSIMDSRITKVQSSLQPLHSVTLIKSFLDQVNLPSNQVVLKYVAEVIGTCTWYQILTTLNLTLKSSKY